MEYLDSPRARTGQKPRRTDYREILSPSEFALFAKLRELRKWLAAQEGVPVYAVLTNEQMAALGRANVPGRNTRFPHIRHAADWPGSQAR